MNKNENPERNKRAAYKSDVKKYKTPTLTILGSINSITAGMGNKLGDKGGRGKRAS